MTQSSITFKYWQCIAPNFAIWFSASCIDTHLRLLLCTMYMCNTSYLLLTQPPASASDALFVFAVFILRPISMHQMRDWLQIQNRDIQSRKIARTKILQKTHTHTPQQRTITDIWEVAIAAHLKQSLYNVTVQQTFLACTTNACQQLHQEFKANWWLL